MDLVGGFPPLPRPSRKTVFLRLLRKVHAWVGLGGAVFGLLFGLTGFLLNHRGVMKIEAGQIQERKVVVEFAEAPASPEALARDLAARFSVPAARVKWQVKPGRPGRMGGAPIKVADQWTVAFLGHAHFALATYIPGNRTVELEQRDASFVQVLKRLHKADGGSSWVDPALRCLRRRAGLPDPLRHPALDPPGRAEAAGRGAGRQWAHHRDLSGQPRLVDR
ncbi:MAG: PepSY-associated TM helix domain-containing protein [Holophagaceae bacterium]|nr:PepSY-associated TM helix domain-containing protein [Holophagaceae bacterium]